MPREGHVYHWELRTMRERLFTLPWTPFTRFKQTINHEAESYRMMLRFCEADMKRMRARVADLLRLVNENSETIVKRMRSGASMEDIALNAVVDPMKPRPLRLNESERRRISDEAVDDQGTMLDDLMVIAPQPLWVPTEPLVGNLLPPTECLMNANLAPAYEAAPASGPSSTVWEPMPVGDVIVDCVSGSIDAFASFDSGSGSSSTCDF